MTKQFEVNGAKFEMVGNKMVITVRVIEHRIPSREV